jgi:hypothetical protein
MRETLIDAIIDLADDEYESKNDLIELARKSEHELVDILVGIACFYRDQLDDVNQ